MRRRDFVAALAGGAVAMVLAGGVAWAAIPDAGGTYTACMLKNVGTVRLIDKSLPSGNLMSKCTALETEISWSQRGPQGLPGMPGQNGADGQSQTVTQLAVGDSNCAAGGAAITDAEETTAYVCNGADGADGTDGDPFSGTFTSPNGAYSISVTDSGITLSNGSNASISLVSDDITVRAADTAAVEGQASVTARGSSVSLQSSAILSLLGSQVRMNAGSGCLQAARAGDTVVVNPTSGSGVVTTGSPTVCIG